MARALLISRYKQSKIFLNPDSKISKTSSIIIVNKGELSILDYLKIKKLCTFLTVTFSHKFRFVSNF